MPTDPAAVAEPSPTVSGEGPAAPQLVSIRMFADSKLQESIDRALATLAPGSHGAVVAYATTTGANLAVVGKLGQRWSVVGVLSKPYDGKLEGEAAVRFSW